MADRLIINHSFSSKKMIISTDWWRKNIKVPLLPSMLLSSMTLPIKTWIGSLILLTLYLINPIIIICLFLICKNLKIRVNNWYMMALIKLLFRKHSILNRLMLKLLNLMLFNLKLCFWKNSKTRGKLFRIIIINNHDLLLVIISFLLLIFN